MLNLDQDTFFRRIKTAIRGEVQARKFFGYKIRPREVVNEAMADIWPIDRQYKITLEPYMDALRDAFGCSFTEVKSKRWAASYRFNVGKERWTLSQGDRSGYFDCPTLVIRVNDWLDVGRPEDLVELISFVNGILPALQNYTLKYAEGKMPDKSSENDKDRITYEMKMRKGPISLSVPRKGITEELLNRKCQEYNALYFAGRLPSCAVRFYSGLITKKKPALGVYNGHTIFIDYYSTYQTDGYLRSLLLHEMIHHYIDTCFPLASKTEMSHGPTFQRIRRLLNRKYGLRIDQRMTKAQRGYSIAAVEV